MSKAQSSPAPEPDKHPASPARIRANQQNAKRSTGPRTAEGKAVSARNSTRHGCYAGPEPIAAGSFREEAEDVRQFFADIVEGLTPRDRLELAAAERIARVLLRARRLAVLDDVLLTSAAALDVVAAERRRRRDRQALVRQLRDWLLEVTGGDGAASARPQLGADETAARRAAAAAPPPYIDVLGLLAEADAGALRDGADAPATSASGPVGDADEPLIALLIGHFGDLDAAASWTEQQLGELLAVTADADARARHDVAERCLAVMERTGTVALPDRSASGGALPVGACCQMAGMSSSKAARRRCLAVALGAIS
jgi:hypothetical protein